MSTVQIFFIFIFLGYITSATAQIKAYDAENIQLIDNSIRYGRLPNGFTYFLKSLPGTQSKTYMRLFNKTGSNQDDPDQLNAAHAVEHLAFKSSKNFPLGIVNSEQAASFNLGKYDYLATSGPRVTEYEFYAPNGNTEALDHGLLWFKDIVMGLHLTDADIDQVRGELRQEIIFRNGDHLNEFFANTKLNAQLFPCSTSFLNFFNHHNTFKPETLRRFYKDWYRPDLMAISIVGNIKDLNELEKRIKQTFLNIPSPKNPRNLKNCDYEYFKRAPQFQIVERPTDSTKLLQNNALTFKLFFRDPVTSENIHITEGIKRMMIMEILATVINKRFNEITNEYQSFNLSSRYPYVLRKLPTALEIVMHLENTHLKKAITKSIRELNRLKRYGITSEEWNKIKKKQLQSFTDVEVENPEYWLSEIRSFFAYGEALPENKYSELKHWMTNLSLQEFNDFADNFLSKHPEDIGLIAPVGHKTLSYKENEVRSWIKNAYKEEIEPYKPLKISASLMKAVEVDKLKEVIHIEKGRGASGARELVLENGLNVVLKNFKPSSGSKTSINISGFSIKGAKSLPKDYYYSALKAPAIVSNAGVKGMNKFEVKSILSSTSLPQGIYGYVGDYESGVKCKAEIGDLEIMLQLVFLYFTDPNKHKLAFKDWKDQEYKAYQNPSYNLIDFDFKNSMRTFLGGSAVASNNFLGIKFLSGTAGFEAAKKINFQTAYESFAKLFGDPEDFTFIISGNFDVDTVLPLVKKYLGNIPDKPHSFSYSLTTLNSNVLGTGPTFVEYPAPEYYRMKNMMYGINFIENANDPVDWKEQIRVEALAGVTSEKMWDLRFKKGYSLYDVGAWGLYNNEMERYEIGYVFSCVPSEFSKIRQETKRIVEEIKSGNISKEEFENGVKRMYFLYNAKRANHPRVMHQKLYNYYRYGQPWIDPWEKDDFVKSLTVGDVLEAANEYYDEENLYEFMMKDGEPQNEF